MAELSIELPEYTQPQIPQEDVEDTFEHIRRNDANYRQLREAEQNRRDELGFEGMGYIPLPSGVLSVPTSFDLNYFHELSPPRAPHGEGSRGTQELPYALRAQREIDRAMANYERNARSANRHIQRGHINTTIHRRPYTSVRRR